MEWLFSVILIKLYLLVVRSYSVKGMVVAFRGRSVVVACVVGRERSIVENLANLTFTWRDGHGHVIDQHGERYHVTEYGDLYIDRVHLADSGEYTCNVTGSGEGQMGSPRVVRSNYTRPVIAASLPRVVAVDTLFYEVANCSGHQVDTKKRHISWELCQGLKPRRCRFYVSYTCLRRHGRNELAVNISQGVTSVDISPDNTECGEKCLTEALMAKLQQNNATVSRVIDFEQRRIPIYNKSPLLLRHGKQRIYHSCEPGHEIRRRRHLCLPCRPGKWTPGDNQRCRLCPSNSYRSDYGASLCLPCSQGKTTSGEGAVSEAECHEITGFHNVTLTQIERVREYVCTHVVVVALFTLIVVSIIFTISALVFSCSHNKPRGYVTIARDDSKLSKSKSLESGDRVGEPGHGDNLTLSSDSDENDIFTRASPNPVKGNKPGGEVTKWQPLLWRRSSSATGSGDAAMVEKPVLLPFPPSSFRREQVGVGVKKPRDVEGAFIEERKLKPISRWAVRGRQESAVRDRRSPRRGLNFSSSVTPTYNRSLTSVSSERRVSLAAIRAYDAATVAKTTEKANRSDTATIANELRHIPSINDCMKTLSSYNQVNSPTARAES
ncbi:hypothetical protein LSAT2_021535 [Lamellibrachia satsuma]|nr:hypothetical protein LSAT2_021535 [Lamellibrachia satsuma]